MSKILTTHQLCKTYMTGPQKVEVLKGIDLEVSAGEIVVIIGPSGVGKSTLLHLIGGLDRPTAGEVLIDGEDLFSLRDRELAVFRNNAIGFVFQFHHLLPEFTALENVMIPGMMHGRDFTVASEKAQNILDEIGLGQRLNHKPSELSGGEQQRVAVARALINGPRLVLADEPTGNLDKQNSEALYELILELNKKHGQTLIIVTHNELMATHAHRVIELEDGKIKNNLTAKTSRK
ncbi:MAG: ABC transporter ATP-binding protein [Calditrichia bacterium]|nr:ABC transporter ATP-binding protein [Calditrichia bacterium]